MSGSDLANGLRQAAELLGRKGGTIGGKSRSEAKRRAAKENGRLGGRPKQKPVEPENEIAF